jgi:3-oxoadipate enol-lactonase
VGSGTFRTSDGCMLAFRVHPAPGPRAPRIALVHSLGLDRSMWDGVVAVLKEHAEIFTYDCRGHGRSERRAMPYTVELFARDLAELLDHAGWPSAAVAGCSMGGCVAQAFASLCPARVTALGLISTTAWYGAKAPALWHERAEIAKTQGLRALVDSQLERWFGESFRKLDTTAAGALVESLLANDVQCYAAACEMLGATDLRPGLGAIAVPTTVIAGEEDLPEPLSMARALHKAIAGSALTSIPKSRHLTPVERPKETAEALLALLEPRR